MSELQAHENLMRQALAVARRGWGTTHPNPMVGALMVENGQVVAEGAHTRDGGLHAERLALQALVREPRPGATLYVTLEPCSTAGRTGACTDAIIAAGIRQVVVGATDPNPLHAGRGFAVLRAAGVEVVTGVLERECTDLNLIFNHWIVHGTPLFASKSAVTLDGRIACRSGDSQWITGEEARADVMHWRRLFPAIAVGSGTVMKDNPRLTARIKNEPEWCPLRFVFDGLLRTVTHPLTASVYTDEFRERTIVVTTPHGGMACVRKLEEQGVRVWRLPSTTPRVPMAELRKRCAKEQITGVCFEGGAQLVSQILQEGQLDYMFVYRSPVLLADDRAKPVLTGLRTDKLADAIRLTEIRHESFADDVLTRGKVSYPAKLLIDEDALGRG